MHENEIGQIILDAAYRVHSDLGPGLLESSYEKCLAYEAIEAGLNISTQVPLPLIYRGLKLDCGFRIDMLVEDKVIVEIKTVEELNDIHLAQILTYLKLSGCKLGYLINFNVSSLRKGIRRILSGTLE